MSSHYRHNEIHFLGFKIIRGGHNTVWIEFIKWFRGVLNYFDIVNNLAKFLKAVADRLYYRSKHGVLKKSGTEYYYGNGRKRVNIDIWEMRKTTRTSFREYIFNSKWLKQRELLKYRTVLSGGKT